jgi:hypothetical protein
MVNTLDLESNNYKYILISKLSKTRIIITKKNINHTKNQKKL